MEDNDKTKDELKFDLRKLRKRLKEVEASEEENKRVIDELRNDSAKYQAIVHSFDGLIYICSENYDVEFMNEKFLERTGFNPVGQKCYKALHDLDNVCSWCVNERVFQGEKVSWEVLSPKDDRWYYVINSPIFHPNGKKYKMSMIQDISNRKSSEAAQEKIQEQLQSALTKVLSGYIPICSSCKKVRDGNKNWIEIESYVRSRTEAHFSHGICPDCIKKLYPGL
ncbi:MAG: hypothetical protein D8M57_07285 [Candidatus Scalindua sp. AMX11]|nr:MAG: hypothetical protein DWQ00_05535 [Candidatus Scalindua sp.]NOG82460.1 hypothetical protein [Planctomycetota bacterium]RZV93896.1 MAG: hypothetical protein EX341_03300 [Candidatus Scalindua sp. SCAELEC01]TDE65516.1 MAG: hypothetical protein D8M57_07285 [Candidatus Scalindua sp. AMX11]GJQ58097.1 MAG: hypothetical protein SCALA701_08980 [Candidatus Scalindua sp.]